MTTKNCPDIIYVPFITEGDIDKIVSAFAKLNWIKSRSVMENYLNEQYKGERKIWLAKHEV